MVEPTGTPFQQLFWWSDGDRVLRVAVVQHDSVFMTVCGHVGFAVGER
jgi:hypothetical protein